MTREETMQQFKNVSFDCGRKDNEKILLLSNAEIIVDMVYDNLENRICKNCKYFYIDKTFKSPVTRCSLGCAEILVGSGFQEVSRNFGCNKFERKEK